MIEETAVYNGTTYRLRVFEYGPPLIEFNAETGESTYGPPHDPAIWGAAYAYARDEDGEWDWIDTGVGCSTAAEAMLALKREIIVMGEVLEHFGHTRPRDDDRPRD